MKEKWERKINRNQIEKEINKSRININEQWQTNIWKSVQIITMAEKTNDKKERRKWTLSKHKEKGKGNDKE